MDCLKQNEHRKYRLENSAGYHLFRVSMALKQGLRRAFHEEGLGVTPEQFGILSILWEQEGLSQRELAGICFKDMASVTRMVDALEGKGMVRRKQDPSDRRSHRLLLTQRGRGMRRLLVPLAREFQARSFSCLSEMEREELMRMLQLLFEHIHSPANGEQEEDGSRASGAKPGKKASWSPVGRE